MQTTYYRRPEILARNEFKKGHAVIEASAGTGKTFTLEHLVLDLIINREARIEEILVVTFTEAATRELRERVRALIRKICDEGEATIPDGENPSHYWTIDEATRGRLREALFRFDGAAISTIHGFCHRVLSEQAFLGGRLFEQEQVDGKEAFGFSFREEIRTVLAEESPPGNHLREWIEKDNSLDDLEALLYQCHKEGAPERCPVTPRWDPGGLREALEELPDPEELKEAARQYFEKKNTINGYIKHFDSLDETVKAMQEASSPEDAVNIFTEWANKVRSIDKIEATQFERLRSAAEMQGSPDVMVRLAEKLDQISKKAAPLESFFVYSLLPRVETRLAARKRSLGQIDFDDMLLGVKDALSRDGAETLLAALRRRWKYALVDEFQDTDPVQWEIFRKIFVDDTKDHRLFIIGDPKQAIYGFRGADVHTYEVAKNYLLNKKSAGRVPLVYNFRSTKDLIEAVNEVITGKDDEGKGFFSGLNRYDEPVSCGDPSRFAKEAGEKAVPVHLLHLFGEGQKLNAFSLRRSLAFFIAEEIKRLTGGDNCLVTGNEKKAKRPVSLSNIHILTRTAREGEQIGEALKACGIPHAFYKQEGLFQTEEASDVYKLLCAIDAPADPASKMSAWLTPFFEIPLADLPAWRDTGQSHPLTGMLLDWKHLADTHAWTELFERITTASGIMRRLVFSKDERLLTNYLHLFEILQAEAYARPVTLTELARNLKARIDGRKQPEGREGNVQRLETDREAVQILTMHKAKGLEAEVVFIAGGFTEGGGRDKAKIYHRGFERRLHLGKGTGEIAEAIKKEEDEENQRLLYVAITRAKSRLYLPYFGDAPPGAPAEIYYGYKQLSTFYKRLQKQLDLLAGTGLSDHREQFLTRELPCRADQSFARKGAVREPESPAADELKELLEEPPSSSGVAAALEPYHRGVLLTSYTRMKRGTPWQAPAGEEEEQAVQRSEEVAGEAATQEAGGRGFCFPSELPGGREAGIFLHALIENTPVEEIRERNFEEWSALETVRQRTSMLARRHGFSEDYLPAALQLVFNALCSPVFAGSAEGKDQLALPGGIVSGKNHLAEMAFVYPIPEDFHPLLTGDFSGKEAVAAKPFKAVRGYLQGLIDLVFEYDHKFYLLDWKSDYLNSYNRQALDQHVQANYYLQAEFYTLAVIRQLSIKSEEDYEKRFGGVIYSFIRGVEEASDNLQSADLTETKANNRDGIWYSRPSWPEITKKEKELVARRQWGGEVITANTAPGESRQQRGGLDDEGH